MLFTLITSKLISHPIQFLSAKLVGTVESFNIWAILNQINFETNFANGQAYQRIIVKGGRERSSCQIGLIPFHFVSPQTFSWFSSFFTNYKKSPGMLKSQTGKGQKKFGD